MNKLKGWLSVKEFADRCGFSRQYAFQLISSGKVKSVERIGRAYIVAEKEVNNFKRGQS